MGGAVDAVAREVAEGAGYGAFSPTDGHGVGLESTRVRVPPSDDDVLPGRGHDRGTRLYVPGLGGVRIEDMVEVGEDGCRVIGRPTRLIEL